MPKNKTLPIILILTAIISISAALIAARVYRTKENKTAKIYQNGELIREINLDTIDEPIEFDITDDSGHTNTVRAEHGKIHMESADCPDKICVNQGWIQNGAVPIVCLPNKVTIEITGTDGDIDGQTGGI